MNLFVWQMFFCTTQSEGKANGGHFNGDVHADGRAASGGQIKGEQLDFRHTVVQQFFFSEQ